MLYCFNLLFIINR